MAKENKQNISNLLQKDRTYKIKAPQKVCNTTI